MGFLDPDKFDCTDSDVMLDSPTSSYCTLNKINLINNSTDQNSLSLYHFNVRSLPKNHDTLNEFFYSLDRPPTVVGISETKVNDKSSDNIKIKGYKFYHNDSSTEDGGTYISK